MKKILLISLLATGFASKASAQVTVFASASVTIVRPLTVVKKSDLDFGTVILDLSVPGSKHLSLDPLQQAAPNYGSGLIPSGSNTAHIAQFSISGSPNASISISSSTVTGRPQVYVFNSLSPSFPLAIGLVCAIGTTLTDLNQQSSAVLDASGNQNINVGGILEVPSVTGGYEGFFTSQNAITFTINYN